MLRPRDGDLGPNGSNQAPNSKQWVVSFWTDSTGLQPASYIATIDAGAVKTTSVAGGGWFGATPAGAAGGALRRRVNNT